MTDNQQPILKPEEEASEEEFEAALKEAQEAASVQDEDYQAVAGEQFDALDSLQGNEFALELDGEPVEGIFRVAGLTTFRLEASDNLQNHIIITKMVQRDATLPFNAWIQETINAGKAANRPTRSLAVVAIDDGEETRRWTLTDTYITAIHYTDFDTSSNEFVEEIVEVRYDNISEMWTWSDNQAHNVVP